MSQRYQEDAAPWDFDLSAFCEGNSVDLHPQEFVKRLNDLWDAGLATDPLTSPIVLTLGAFAARLIECAYAIRMKHGTLELSFAARQFAES